jgi:hypothetical protein
MAGRFAPKSGRYCPALGSIRNKIHLNDEFLLKTGSSTQKTDYGYPFVIPARIQKILKAMDFRFRRNDALSGFMRYSNRVSTRQFKRPMQLLGNFFPRPHV